MDPSLLSAHHLESSPAKLAHPSEAFSGVSDAVASTIEACGLPALPPSPRAERVLAWESRVLEAISSGANLQNTLGQIALGLETIIPGAIASVLLASADGSMLLPGASPSLPHSYTEALAKGVPVGPASGSCGTAAFRRKLVIVDDIDVSPLWANFVHLTREHNLRACWSMPVLDAPGSVVATVSVYYREPRAPEQEDIRLIGRTAHLVSIAVARDRRESEMRGTEERFRLLARATNDAIWDWDLRANRLWWSEGFETMFGFRREELEQGVESWTNRLHPDDVDRIYSDVKRALDEGDTTWESIYRFRRKDGTFAWVHDRGHAVRDAEGKAIRMIGGLSDVTERRLAEERIAEQAALIDEARDAIVVRDLDDRITFWSKGAERLYGWTAAEVSNREFDSILGVDPAEFERAARAVRSEGSWHDEMQKKSKSGNTLTVDARWTLLRDSDGKPKSVLSIDSDITERKKLEAQFLRTQRMESIGTLAGGIAHDLNNVLAPILMAVEVLEPQVTEQNGKDMLSVVAAGAQRAADLIRQVLSFARGVEGSRVVINPAHVLREIERIISDTFPKNITAQTHVPRDTWTVTGDPTQLHQVLMNLCVNARDAMTEGGKLTIELKNVVLDELYAKLTPDSKPGPYLLVTVRDTGMGMRPEVMDKIFEPFYTTKAVGSGTGLGLSTTLAIVRSHNGFIHVSSEPGKGATFNVYFPANTTQTADDQSGKRRAGLPRGNGELILVVDDEEGVRTVARHTLETFGYRVKAARHGAEAVALYAKHGSEVAVVLTDIAMPVMDGPTMIIALRAMNPDVKVIVTSGHSSHNSIADAHQFIPKPYSAERLLRAIDGMVREAEPSEF